MLRRRDGAPVLALLQHLGQRLQPATVEAEGGAWRRRLRQPAQARHPAALGHRPADARARRRRPAGWRPLLPSSTPSSLPPPHPQPRTCIIRASGLLCTRRSTRPWPRLSTATAAGACTQGSPSTCDTRGHPAHSIKAGGWGSTRRGAAASHAAGGAAPAGGSRGAGRRQGRARGIARAKAQQPPKTRQAAPSGAARHTHLHGERREGGDGDVLALAQPHRSRQPHLQLAQVPGAIHGHQLRRAGGTQGHGSGQERAAGGGTREPLSWAGQENTEQNTAHGRAGARCCHGARMGSMPGRAPSSHRPTSPALTSTRPSIMLCALCRPPPPARPPQPLPPRRSGPARE